IGGVEAQVEPWTPVDSVAWLKAMAWDLRSNMTDEIDRAMAATRLSPEQVDQLYPAYPFDRHRPVVGDGGGRGTTERAGRSTVRAVPGPLLGGTAGAMVREATDQLEATRAAVAALPSLVGHGEGIGSNAWAVDGR